MKRRELIKGLAGITALALLPNMKVLGCRRNDKLHFIGLGTGGTNVAWRIRQKGIEADYSCFNWFPSFIEPYKGFHHIDYEYPREFRQSNELGRKRIPLTNEMKTSLSKDGFYVVFVGLGAFTGTSLITDVVEFLEARNANYLSVCSLPFSNEGRTRNEYARSKMTELIKYKRVKFFDNEEILKKFGAMKISKSFEKADEEMYCIFQQEYYDLIS